MKKFKKFSSFLSVCLSLSVVLGNFSLPVLAYEKEGVNFEQVGTKTTLDNSGATFNKINSSSEEIKGLSPDSSITQKEKIGLEKSQQIEGKKKNYVEGEILVKYKNNKINLNTSSGRTAALNFIRAKSLEKKEDLRKINISILRIKDSKTVEEKVAELKNDPNIEYVEPNYKRYPADINTDDTNRALLWGLDNTGQPVNGVSGTLDADIDAPEAWAISEATTSASAIVAVIDSGVAYNHLDLVTNMWDGTNCKDYNGAVIAGGCNHGYDYEDDDNIPLPTTSSHGTHIAGTIAAVKNNSKGIIGVAPQAKIMAIKYNGTVSNEIKAIDFAIQNGAKVINASFTGADFSQSEYEAIDRFKTAGGIFVAAAGNGDYYGDPNIGDNHDGQIHLYPSDYDLDNIISVAATDQNDNLATFSDYGTTSVDVGAPGINIYSTFADTIILNETFEEVTPPSVPSGWITGGTNNNWGTYNFNDGFWNKVLYGDLALPYANNTNSTITSLTYNLGGNTSGATISFLTACDTEYATTDWRDYMQLEYSTDGTNFFPASDPFFGGTFRWDEAYLDSLNGDSNPSGGAGYYFENLPLPSQFLSNNFKFLFRWVTNTSDNNYDGCKIDYITITKYSDGSDEKYEYMYGTSMAVPHVVGLAGLIWGYKPELTYPQVKDIILTTGDDLSSLAGKTVTGKRINAYNALNSIDVTIPTLSEVIPVPTPTNDNTPDYTFSSDEVGTISYDGGCTSSTTEAIAGDNTISFNELIDGTYDSCTIAVTDASDNTSDSLLVSPFTIDTIIPVITLTGSSTVNLYVGDSYTDAGAIASDDVDGDITANIVVVNPVSTSTVGTYTITYNVSDAAGNPAEQVTRIVNVSVAPDTTAPVIDSFTIPETSNSLTVSISSFTAHDNVGVTGYMLTETSDIPSASDPRWSATVPSDYTFSAEGVKTLYAWAKDAAGNISLSLNDSVTITLPPPPDTEAPVIAFHSDITVGNDPGQAGAIVNYTLPIATDNVDVSVLVICIPPAGTFFPIGDTSITCDATDVAENHAIQTSFKITVTDTEAPVITLTGENPQVIEAGTAYTELGATVSDNQPGSVITIDSSSVNTAVVGSYTVTYDAVDTSGNHAVQVTRTVNVVAVPITLDSIAITTPATKLVYNLGDPLDLTGLVVTGIYSDASTKVETITEANVTGFDSSSPVTGQILTITVDGKTTTYTIDVVAPLSSAKVITSFNFTTPAATGVIAEADHTIVVTVPFGTDVTALVPTIIITGASVSPASGVAQNFTTLVTYTVTAEDNTTQTYTVTVTVAANSAKDITSFNFAGLTPNVTGVISGTDITLNVPYGTDVIALVPTIVITGASVNPASGVAQDFTNPVTYTVTATDASTQDYIVTVTIAAPSSAKAITSFVIGSSTGTIDETAHTVAVTVPFGTVVTALAPTIVVSDKATVDPASGAAKDFTAPVTYIVTAEDNTTQAYIVTVIVATPSNVATVTSAIYTVSALEDGAGTITNVPFGTSKATFEAALAKGQADQTWNDTGITDPVVTGNTLVVTAQDGTTTATYTVTVNAEPSHDATLSNLTISSGTLSPAFSSDTKDYTDSVDNSVTSVTITPTANQANATITVNGNTVASGSASGQIALNVGSNTILTVVTAQDGVTIGTYTITVNRVAPAVSPGGSTPVTVTQTTTKKGDANGDNKVDKYDFSLMMANWGKIGSNICDLNNDSKVDKYDFALLMLNWSM